MQFIARYGWLNDNKSLSQNPAGGHGRKHRAITLLNTGLPLNTGLSIDKGACKNTGPKRIFNRAIQGLSARILDSVVLKTEMALLLIW